MSLFKYLGAAALCIAAGTASAAFPERELSGVIMWAPAAPPTSSRAR